MYGNELTNPGLAIAAGGTALGALQYGMLAVVVVFAAVAAVTAARVVLRRRARRR